MATLENAADELVVKLRGLDSEIEESEHQLEDLHQRVDHVREDVDQEWTAFTKAVTSLLRKVTEDRESLAQQVQATGQAIADAQRAVADDGAQARSEIAQGHAQLESLGQHAAGLQPGVESLATEAGQAPAKALAEEAHALEQDLQQLMEDTRAFLHDEAVPAITQAAEDFHDRCQELHRQLTDEIPSALQETLGEWESKVEQAEQYVASQAFQASRPHAQGMVDYAMSECRTQATRQMDDLQQLMTILTGQLQQFGSEIHAAAEALVDQAGAQLNQGLEQAREAAGQAVGALDAMKDQLGVHGFVSM